MWRGGDEGMGKEELVDHVRTRFSRKRFRGGFLERNKLPTNDEHDGWNLKSPLLLEEEIREGCDAADV
jgi:hypothetical protein